MKTKMVVLAIATSLTFLSACASVKLREDVFLAKPVWESTDGPLSKLQGAQIARAAKLNELPTSAPALAGLVKQVLNEQISLDANKTLTISNSEGKTSFRMEVGYPLPAVLAEHPITRATVVSMRESWLSAQKVRTTGELPNLDLSLRNFQDFISVLHKVALSPYTSEGSKAISKLDSNLLTWEGLFQKYLAAYYNGKFVDRTGGLSSKPKLGLTITNETITALELIFLESLWDWAIIGGGLSVPILYEGDPNNPNFLTAEARVPTLWTTLKDFGMALPVKKIIERPVEEDVNPGISKSELCAIRKVSGLAGDAAQGITGIIVRALGGANIGFTLGLGALGKFSLGDNDTLTKVVDTWTENTGRRATEFGVAPLLYENSLPKEIRALCSGIE